MNPPGVVKIHIMLDTKAELQQADILPDFDVLIFQRPPETLHFCIILRHQEIAWNRLQI